MWSENATITKRTIGRKAIGGGRILSALAHLRCWPGHPEQRIEMCPSDSGLRPGAGTLMVGTDEFDCVRASAGGNE